MRIFVAAVCLVFVVLQSTTSFSAPSPWMKPVTLEGTVVEVSWIPLENAKGNPGMWGSARQDRTFPAHYKVKLANIIVPVTVNEQYPFYKNGESTNVRLNHEEDDGYLKPGMRIKITDYQSGGDEGGEWSRFMGVEILSREYLRHH